LAQRVLGRDFITGGVATGTEIVRLKNGLLAYRYTNGLETDDLPEMTAEVKALRDTAASYGGHLLYVAAPHKADKFSDVYPNGYPADNLNGKQDQFLRLLADADVDFLDLRAQMQKESYDYADAFYVTDHHWRSEAGIRAAATTVAALNARYGAALDESIFSLDLYNQKTYAKLFLGSQGKRVGPLYAGKDDFTVFTPKFETNVTLEIPSKQLVRTGTFAQAFLFTEYLANDPYVSNSYQSYIGASVGFRRFLNHNAPENGKKILLVRDSFAHVYTPFLSLVCAQIDEFDLRYDYGEKSLAQYVRETKPDIVLFLYNPSSLTAANFRFSAVPARFLPREKIIHRYTVSQNKGLLTQKPLRISFVRTDFP
jgi:hypothetical protein